MNILKFIIAGLVVESVASFDDMVTRIPIISQFTKTLRGRIAFSVGSILAITVTIFMAWFFSSLFEGFAYTHIVTSTLIMLLAIAVYFDWFSKKQIYRIDKTKHHIKKKVFKSRFIKLLWIGFLFSFVTLIDDTIVLIPFFSEPWHLIIAAIVGVYLSMFIQVLLLVYAAKKLYKLKFLKEIAALCLLFLAVIVYFKVF